MYSAFNTAATRQPDEAAALGILQHLGKDELQAMLEDDARMDGLINDLPQVRGLQDEKESVLATNKSIAEYNLSKDPVLSSARAQLASSYTRARQLHQEFSNRVQQLNNSGCGQMNTDTALAMLRTAGETSEQTAEDRATAFLDGDSEVEDFLDSFVSLSTRAHAQKIKTEKLQTIATRMRHGLPPSSAGPMRTPSASQPKHNFYAAGAAGAGAPQWGGNAPYSPGTGSTPYFRS